MPSDTFTRSSLSRRAFLGSALAGLGSLAGCVSVPSAPPPRISMLPMQPFPPSNPASRYDAVVDDGYEIPPAPVDKIDPRYLRQEVPDPTGEAPGTIVVDTSQHFLYLVHGGGRATRYGVGLGRAGFEWSGRAVVARKARWPRWFPPDDMIDRQAELEKYRASYDKDTGRWLGGMEPGITNPLGARALYLYENGVDTLYRIHGSPEWWTIGRSVSSGCVRMINQDVIDLYDQVPIDTPVFVTSGITTV